MSDADLSLFTSSESDEWYTPREFLAPIVDAVDGFDVDPASGAEESPIADVTFDQEQDGLSEPWFGRVWCNPPYSEIADWAEKFARESTRDAVDLVVVLVKGDTSSNWYHDHILQADYLAYVDERLTFGGGDDQAPFASHVAIYGDPPDALLSFLETRGVVVPVDSIRGTDDSVQATLDADSDVQDQEGST